MKQLAIDSAIVAAFFAVYVFAVDVDDTGKWKADWLTGYCEYLGFLK